MASIRKRNDKWQVQVRRDGQRPVSKTFISYRDAQLWARQQELRADKQELTHDTSMLRRLTVGDLVDRYLREITPQKKSAAAERYVLLAFRGKSICTKALSDIRQSDFAQYRDQRLTELEPSSLRREFNPIQNMFEVARDEWGLPIKENPLAKLKLKATDNRRERRLQEGELERLVEVGKKLKNPYVLAVALFAIETAMRRGEMLSLRWPQVDLRRRSVTILESKNGYSRTIPLTSKAVELLHSCRDLGGRGDQANDGVFPITANALRLSWERLCRRSGVEDLHFHDLRHEAVSRFFEIGLSVPEVASISGHKDMRMLMRYAHADRKGIDAKLARSDQTSQVD